jgi:hypothetical protein
MNRLVALVAVGLLALAGCTGGDGVSRTGRVDAISAS